MDDFDVTVSKKEQFLIKVNDMEQKMGFLYSVILRRILPFLIFFFPINVVLELSLLYINRHFPNTFINTTFLLVSWIIAQLGFLTLLIVLPKVATVVEFIFGPAFLFLVIHYSLLSRVRDYLIFIGVILFLLVKLVFIVFKIMGKKEFKDDKINNIGCDENGRVVRLVSEEVFFTQEENDDNEVKPASNDEVFFVSDDDNEDFESEPSVDNEVFFVSNDDNDALGETPTADDDYFFG